MAKGGGLSSWALMSEFLLFHVQLLSHWKCPWFAKPRAWRSSGVTVWAQQSQAWTGPAAPWGTGTHTLCSCSTNTTPGNAHSTTRAAHPQPHPELRLLGILALLGACWTEMMLQGRPADILGWVPHCTKALGAAEAASSQGMVWGHLWLLHHHPGWWLPASPVLH